MAEQLGEKTEAPTPKRKKEARGKGQVPKSQDLASVIVLAVSVIAIVMFGGRLLEGLAGITRAVLDSDTTGPLTPAGVVETTTLVAKRAIALSWPLGLAALLASWLGQFMQVGWLFTLKPLEPKFDRLNPISGTKRLFGLRSAVKSGVNILKLLVVVTVAALVIGSDLGELAAMARLGTLASFVLMGRMVLELAALLLLAMLAIALLDFAYQKWQHTQDSKMTKHEVKDERKSMEGDAETKARRQRMAREVLLQQIQRDVPRADVIVTNPTHFAVALRYDEKTMRAPVVLAKGADFLALRIREIASAHRIPIIERPPLARALYHNVEVGQAISPEHYEAVAEILAYVYRMEGRAA